MIETPKPQKDRGRKVSLLPSFLEAAHVLRALVCFRESSFVFEKKKNYVFILLYFTHFNTNGHIQCPRSAPCFFVMYLGDSSSFTQAEFLCSSIWLHGGLFKGPCPYSTGLPGYDGWQAVSIL